MENRIGNKRILDLFLENWKKGVKIEIYLLNEKKRRIKLLKESNANIWQYY